MKLHPPYTVKSSVPGSTPWEAHIVNIKEAAIHHWLAMHGGVIEPAIFNRDGEDITPYVIAIIRDVEEG